MPPKIPIKLWFNLYFKVMRNGREIYRFGDRGVALFCAERERLENPNFFYYVLNPFTGEIHA